MARAWSLLRDGVIPLVIFPGLLLPAKHFIFGHLYESGLDKHLASACTPHATELNPFRLSYTGVNKADIVLCPLVTLFHAALEEPDAVSFLIYFIGMGAPLVAIPLVESYRSNRGPLIALPVVFGLLAQTLTIGMVFPVYWLVFIVSGGANAGRGGNPEEAKITQGHAEAIVFGVVVGAAIPSIGMLMLSNPHITAIWQPYPVYVFVLQLVHLAFRPPSKHSQSGYKTIRFLYISTLIMCAACHIITIWPLVKNMDTLKRVYLPSLIVPSQSASAGIRVLHFLKWDFVFGFGSFIIATLWFTTTVTQTMLLALWHIVATPVLGPGAVIAGAALWRESSLQVVFKGKAKES